MSRRCQYPASRRGGSGRLGEPLRKRPTQRLGQLLRRQLRHHGRIPLIRPAAHTQKTERRQLDVTLAESAGGDTGPDDVADLVEIFLPPGTNFGPFRPFQLAVMLEEGAHVPWMLRDLLENVAAGMGQHLLRSRGTSLLR